MSLKLSGLNNVLENLNKEIKEIEGRTLKGLIRAVILIRRDMEFTPPLIPVDLGNLRASWFVVTSNGAMIQGSGPKFVGEKADRISQGHAETLLDAQRGTYTDGGPYVVFGFGAYYAAFVHEMIGANFQRHGSCAMFLSNAIARNSNRILQIIAKEAKIK